MKVCRKLTALVLFSTLFTVVSTQTSNAGIETDDYCAVDFGTAVEVQPVSPAFTYEVKTAFKYDDNPDAFGNTNTNSYGGVLTTDHTVLLGSSDLNNGLKVYYNTNWLDDKSPLFFVGKGESGQHHYFNNPAWKFPNFTKSEGSSPYVHIAVVRNSAGKLTIFFNGVAPTKSWSSNSGESGGFVGNWTNSSFASDSNTYTTARYAGWDTRYNTSRNPDAYISGIKFVTGYNVYDPTAASITIPSNTTMRTAADTGTTTGVTPILLNSLRAPSIVKNDGNASLPDASLYSFGGGTCPVNPQEAYIGGDGVYNVYYKEGDVLKTSGQLPSRTYYYSEDPNPDPITIPTSGDLVKTSNEFVGWNTQMNGLGQTYRAGSSYRPTNNITLYTKWSTRKTITYNYNGGTGTLPTESNKLWEDTFTVAANAATNGDLNFNGWSDGSITYGAGSTYTVSNNDVTLTAVWSGDTTTSISNVAITAPVANEIPVSSLISNGQYTTAISWNTTPVTFDYNTIYTATVTVTPVTGYTLTGVNANFFTVNGNAATTANSLNAGSFTYQFPRTALGPAETPRFDTPTATADGFSVTITNYDSSYTWDTPTVSRGSVAITSTSTPNRVLTVTGLSPGDSATITQTTSRVNYSSGSNTVTGTTLPPLNPTFGSVTRNNGGFSVPITNYDSDYTWDTPTVSRGSVAVTYTGEWSTNSDSSGSKAWSFIASSGDGAKLAATVYGGDIWTSTNSGSTWTESASTGSKNWFGITSSSDGTKLAATVYGGAIWTSTNSGSTWTESASTGPKNWTAITSSSDGTKLAAVTWYGSIWTSSNSGSTWAESASTGPNAWIAIAASSDGTKLAAVVDGGSIWTSSNSGSTWTESASTGPKAWIAIAASSDGTKLAATVLNGSIWTSSNSGSTWTESTSTGPKKWYGITSSSDGTKLAAVANGGDIWTSTNSGSTWTESASTGPKDWYTIASSSDGTKLAAVVYSGAIYTFAPSALVLTVTGLSAGDTATITQTTRRTNYPNGTNSVTGTAQVPLNPTFGSVTRTATGFTVSITNYDADYTWDTPTVTTGTVAITSTDGANRLLTVTGLSPADSATITQATSRSNYPNGTNAVAGTALNAAYNPTFDTPTATGVGFSVSITNYDASYTWDTPTVSRGSVAVTGTGEWSTNSNSSGLRVWLSIASSSDGTKLAAVENVGYIYTSTDSGATWSQQIGSGSRAWRSIASSSDGTKLAAVVSGDSGGYIYTSTNSGVTWTEQTNSGSKTWRSIASSSDGTKLAAVVLNGYIYTSTDSGATWSQQTVAGSSEWRSIASSSDGTKLAAVANRGYIYTSIDSGATWSQRTGAGLRAWRWIASSSDGTKLAAVANDGNVYTSTNSGATWSQRTVSSSSSEWRSIASSSDGTKLAAVKETGYIHTSTDSGATWNQQTVAGSREWRSIASSSDGTKLASVALNGYIYTFAPRTLTVTGLSAGDTATITQTVSRDTYALGSNTVTSRTLLVITTANVAITAPVAGATPVSSLVSNGQYTTAITWSDTPTTFAPNTVYTATVTITPDAAYMLSGVGANFFTVNGNSATSGNLANAGVFTYQFPETAIIVTTANISITAPATGATPVASIVSNGQYTTAITWSDSPSRFAGITAYTATVTVTPITGYTLTGVAANFFTVNGDTATTGNLVNAGTFTYLFAATGAKLAQAITFTQPAAMSKASSNQALVASSSATGSYLITFTSTTPAVCTIVAGAIRAISAGTCSITASQAGDGIYLAAASVIKSITVTSNKLLQTINFTQPVAMNKASSNQTLVATSSAGISYPITFTSTTTGICTVVAGAIDVLATGTCSITASQAGDGTYNPATSVIRSITVSKIPQIITFNQPAAMTRTSSDQPLVASSNAGDTYTVNFASTTTNVCTVLSRAIHIVAPGTCSITASQAGDSDYATASAVRSIVIGKLTQTITFTTPVAMTLRSGNQTLVASSSATGSYPITFTSTTTRVCKIINGNTLQAVSAGTCSITASQRGDATYLPANNVIKSFVLRSGR